MAAVIRYKDPAGCLVKIQFCILPPVITFWSSRNDVCFRPRSVDVNRRCGCLRKIPRESAESANLLANCTGHLIVSCASHFAFNVRHSIIGRLFQ